MRPVALALFTLSFACVSLLGSAARADDCPPGSVLKSQEGYTLVRADRCENDGQCKPTEICRPVALCMQVGALTTDAATLGEAGQHLVVTQRCAPDKRCPQTTICDERSRCVSKDDATKMGILTVSSAAPAAPAGGAEKKSCGCRAVGERTSDAGAPLFAASLFVVAFARARRGAARPR